MAIFNLNFSDIIDLELKLEGKLPVDRDELLALANSWGRLQNLYTENKEGHDIKIEKCIENKKYDLSKLDVSEITNFNDIFSDSYFNGDINGWDVSNATSMDGLFFCAKEFNSPLDNWNTLNITSLINIFYGAKSFNQNINSWDVSKVTNMNYMFSRAIKFNQPLDKWDTSNVRTMINMFSYTEEFNQNLNSWDVSNVIDMSFMFSDTKAFNQNLNSWDISKVEYMSYILEKAKAFNQPFLLDISKVEFLICMFLNAKAFENRFNNGNPLPVGINEVKTWLTKNKTLMEAIEIEENKNKDLDNFLLNIEKSEIKKIK